VEGNDTAPARKSRFVPALVAFVVVALGVYLTGMLATWVLKKVVLPLLAVVLGWIAARVVYRIRD
jgi:hypothetical protein